MKQSSQRPAAKSLRLKIKNQQSELINHQASPFVFHKPLLLLAAFDLIDEGLATPERIPWCQELRDRFTARFLLVKKHNDQNNPDLPFRYLAGDGFWQAFEGNGSTPINREIRVGDIGEVFARFTDGFQYLVAIPDHRRRMREALISRYFPNSLPIKNQQPKINNRQSDLQVADDTPEYGRSPAFRRKILAIYDHQCAACGLRIKLPAGNDVSFIDAAYLIPFSESQNDHPTNGLALCKNHHWAMDRDIIAPGPDRHWHISKLIDPRRSNGERELHELSGKSLLLPKDPAFHPDGEGLEWRWQKLIACIKRSGPCERRQQPRLVRRHGNRNHRNRGSPLKPQHLSQP